MSQRRVKVYRKFIEEYTSRRLTEHELYIILAHYQSWIQMQKQKGYAPTSYGQGHLFKRRCFLQPYSTCYKQTQKSAY